MPPHEPALVLAALLPAALAAFVALTLLARVRPLEGRATPWSLHLAGVVLGTGIWSLHFVAMLAMHVPGRVRYDLGDVLISLLLGVLGSQAGVYWMRRPGAALPHAVGAGIFFAAGFLAIHYLGVAAMRTAMEVRLDTPWVWASAGVALAAGLGTAAAVRRLAVPEVCPRLRAAGASAIALGTAAMHLTAMGGLRFFEAGSLVHLQDIVAGAAVTVVAVLAMTMVVLVASVFVGLADIRGRTRADAVLERVTDGFVALDAELRCTYVNPAAETLLGRPQSEVLGHRPDTFVPADAGRRLAAVCRRALATQVTQAAETYVAELQRWLELRLYPDAGGLSVYIRDVTDRRAADDALRRREQQLAEAQRITRMGSWEWDLDRRTLSWSDELHRIYGVDPDHFEPSYEEFLARVHPADRPGVEAALVRSIETGEPFAFEERIVRPGGEVRVLQSMGYVVEPDASAGRRLCGTCQDVTELRRTEREHAELHGMIEAVVAASPVAMVAMDAAGDITLWNPAAERTFGWTRDEVVGRPNPLLLDLPGVPDERCRDCGDALGGTGDERCARRKDGSALHVRLSAAPLRGPDGATRGSMAVLTDVTAEKAAAAALGASEERFRTVVENLNEAILITDLEDRVVYASSRITDLTGHTPEELEGRLAYECFDAPSAEDVADRMRSRMGGASERYELRLRRKDGSRVWVEIRGAPYLNAAGEVVGTMGAVADATVRKETEEALRRSELQLRQAQKMEAIGRLAGGIAHDFNNQLTAIQGNAQLVLLDAPADAPFRAELDEVTAAAERAAALTRQLLAFSRQQVLHSRVLNPVTVFSEMRSMIRRLLDESIEVVEQLDPSVGRVRVDPSQLEQVFLNLAVNARDAMPEGGRLYVSVRNAVLTDRAAAPLGIPGGRYVHIAVADTGMGMDDETLQRIFEPFFTTKTGKGTGLGLATVYGIVQQSAGHITVASTPGAGTTFGIYLPRVDEPEDAPRPADDSPWTHRAGETVLVCEDEDAVRAVICRVLRREGYRVLEAERGEAALRAAGAHDGPIHLLLSDVVMPGMSGRVLVERMAELRPGTAALLMSGYTADVYRGDADLAEGPELLEKPFEPELLVRTVRRILDESRAAVASREPDPVG